MKLAIISEMNLEELIENPAKLRIGTSHGPSVLLSGNVAGEDLAFLPRDGARHDIPFHKVNYKANIQSLHKLGVGRILSIDSARATTPDFKPGDLVVPHDLIDLTKLRSTSFYDEAPAIRVDLTNPYCPELRSALVETVKKVAGKVVDEAIYACVEGPRSETLAEMEMYLRLGCKVVSAVGMPEPALARELGICYASLCLIIGVSGALRDPFEVVNRSKPLLKRIVEGLVKRLPEGRTCKCPRV